MSNHVDGPPSLRCGLIAGPGVHSFPRIGRLGPLTTPNLFLEGWTWTSTRMRDVLYLDCPATFRSSMAH